MESQFEKLIKIVKDEMEIFEFEAHNIIDNIRTNLKEYINKNNIKTLVVGISGGLDSSIIAALCTKEHTGIPLIGVSIPLTNTEVHKNYAIEIGKKYCNEFRELNFLNDYIDDIFNDLNSTNDIIDVDDSENNLNENIRQGNLKARLRMITLYDIANKFNGMVLSTDNYSEYNSGFWTICGDVGDYAPIQKLWKGLELPFIAKILGIDQRIIEQKPSDGLNVTDSNTDEAQLGMNYIEFDTIMNMELGFINNKEAIEIYNNLKLNDFKKIEIALKRYYMTQFKRNGTVILERDKLFELN